MQFKSLFASSILAIAAVSAQNATTGALGDAAALSDNPVGYTYTATFNGTVTGTVAFNTVNGTGVAVKVDLRGFVGATGPFNYHVHDQPVPANGNCNATLSHLDPYQRGQATPCDKTRPQTCEVGDLSGKHNPIPNTNGTLLEFHDSYTDLYISTKPGIGAFVGNRSIVIHQAGGGRLTCANIILTENLPSTSAPVFQKGSASTFGVSSFLALGGALAAAVFIF